MHALLPVQLEADDTGTSNTAVTCVAQPALKQCFIFRGLGSRHGTPTHKCDGTNRLSVLIIWRGPKNLLAGMWQQPQQQCLKLTRCLQPQGEEEEEEGNAEEAPPAVMEDAILLTDLELAQVIKVHTMALARRYVMHMAQHGLLPAKARITASQGTKLQT